MNDPNGLTWYGGEYHLFYQHNGASTNWTQGLTWGHAVAPDMLHWQHLPDVLQPGPMANGQPGGSWSGSGLVDWHNTAGFQTGTEKPIVLVWTAVGLGQCIAYSNDRGRTFTQYSGNPVLPMDPPKTGDWDRDPKVYWHEPTHRWTMAISISGKGFEFYSSPDLKMWTRESSFPGMFECPDYFELPVDGNPKQKKWVVWDASSKYYIGQFDGKRFTAESGPFMLDAGRNYYAAQTWNDSPDGRRIVLGWMRDGRFPGMPFNQQMGIPSTLALRTTSEGVRLTKLPVREVETLRYSAKSWKTVDLKPGVNPLAGLNGDTWDIEAILEPGSADEVTFWVRGEPVRWQNNVLSCGGRSVPLPVQDRAVKLRILVDRASIEVFGNDGLASLTTAFVPSEADQTLGLSCTGGSARVPSLKVWRMRSVWR